MILAEANKDTNRTELTITGPLNDIINEIRVILVACRDRDDLCFAFCKAYEDLYPNED